MKDSSSQCWIISPSIKLFFLKRNIVRFLLLSIIKLKTEEWVWFIDIVLLKDKRNYHYTINIAIYNPSKNMFGIFFTFGFSYTPLWAINIANHCKTLYTTLLHIYIGSNCKFHMYIYSLCFTYIISIYR